MRLRGVDGGDEGVYQKDAAQCVECVDAVFSGRGNIDLIPWGFLGNVEQCWEYVRDLGAPAFRRIIEALAPEQHAQVVSEVLGAIRQYDDGQQVNFPAAVVVATGVH